jgi:hypothetical protein
MVDWRFSCELALNAKIESFICENCEAKKFTEMPGQPAAVHGRSFQILSSSQAPALVLAQEPSGLAELQMAGKRLACL